MDSPPWLLVPVRSSPPPDLKQSCASLRRPLSPIPPLCRGGGGEVLTAAERGWGLGAGGRGRRSRKRRRRPSSFSSSRWHGGCLWRPRQHSDGAWTSACLPHRSLRRAVPQRPGLPLPPMLAAADAFEERRCNFASPLSSKGNLLCLLPPLLESFYAMHSSQLLPPVVGLSLTLLYLSQPSITIFTPILKKMY
jgi:hypothetical protein